MVKKINILVLLLLVLLSVGAVSASEDVNLTDNNANSDILEISENSIEGADENLYSASNNEILEANSHTITQSTYLKYFDNKGNLVESTVNEGDTIYLDGTLSDLKFTLTKPVNIVGTSSNNMKNSMITILSGASGSTISNLNIVNT